MFRAVSVFAQRRLLHFHACAIGVASDRCLAWRSLATKSCFGFTILAAWRRVNERLSLTMLALCNGPVVVIAATKVARLLQHGPNSDQTTTMN